MATGYRFHLASKSHLASEASDGLAAWGTRRTADESMSASVVIA